MARTCAICGKRAYSDRCAAHKKRKPIKVSALPMQRKPLPPPKKRIKQQGKQAKLWVDTRKEWLKTNRPPYTCHYCGGYLTEETVTLDHLLPRSRAPERRHDMENLVPACYTCNGLKGSVAHDEYVHSCH